MEISKLGMARDNAMAQRIFRISGYSLLVGAVIFIVHMVLRSVVTSGPEAAMAAAGSAWVPINSLGAVGAVLVLLGLPAMYARRAEDFGALGLAGIILIAVAWMFIGLFLSLYGTLIVPWLAEHAPSLVGGSAPLPAGFTAAFGVGLLAWLAGCVLLAIPFIRGRARPAWVGYALMASAIMMILGNLVLAPSGPASNFAVNLVSNSGPVLLLVGIGCGCLHNFPLRPSQVEPFPSSGPNR